MAQKKRFNVTGPCIPALHYMVDTSEMINLIIKDYVDEGEYFTMNRARQYGKTTTLVALEKALRNQYIPISISFEGFGASVFETEHSFIKTFISACAESMTYVSIDPKLVVEWAKQSEQLNLPALSAKITQIAAIAGQKLVLMIDEVDKSSNNQLFLDFLGMLRDKYISRSSRGTPTFHSVILAGVHDVKNLKMKLRPDEKHSYNSPWNIAARFDVDMSFSAPEIATMLHEYENDHHTGMEAGKVAQRLFYYTSGYPFLVSLLCKTMDEERLEWTETGVMDAVKKALYHSRDISLFQDIQKNIENHDEFKALLVQILVDGIPASYNGLNPATDLGIIYGVLVPCDGKVMITNKIFETFIYNYLISIAPSRPLVEEYTERTKYIANGKLNMPLVLERFAAFMRCEYRDEDGTFIEREGRLLFLSFLKPIINGTGHYVVEPETRGSRRMDVAVFYGGEEHIVELKIWHGEQAANEAYDQLSGYLISQEQQAGYLLSFCDNQKSPREGRTFEYNGCRITEVIVAYRDKE